MFLIFKLYGVEIINYDYKELLSDIPISNWIFWTTLILFTLQNGLNFIMTKLFHSALHTTSQSIMFIPTTPVFAVLVASVVEELVFRRIIFKWLNTKLNFWWAASISSIIFAAGHGSLVGLLGYIVVGMGLCFVYKRTGNLGIAIMIHALMNFFVVFGTAIRMNINL